jgi:DNA processing protein
VGGAGCVDAHDLPLPRRGTDSGVGATRQNGTTWDVVDLGSGIGLPSHTVRNRRVAAYGGAGRRSPASRTHAEKLCRRLRRRRGIVDEPEAWLRLALTPGLSSRAAARAVAVAGSAASVCRWPVERLRKAGGGHGDLLARRPIDVDVGPVRARADALGVRVLTPADPDWPRAAFQGMDDPPAALFLAGALPAATTPCVALVGTRRATPYGLRVAREIAETLARRGICVVSGLAVGIDAAAHAGALKSGAAPPVTLAVLGCGLAVCYPSENALLRDDVAAHGGVLSEHAPDVPPEKWHFPRRNRLVAALAHAVVVVEAPERSGALLTATLAVEAGREVLAVPGPIGRFTHEGCHRLLRANTAALCRGAGDVLEALGLVRAGDGKPASATPVPLPPPGPQLALWSLLDEDETLDADELCRRSALPVEDVTAALASLELDGRIQRIPGAGYRRT